VSVHGGMLTMAGSWWGEKVITPNLYKLEILIVNLGIFLCMGLVN